MKSVLFHTIAACYICLISAVVHADFDDRIPVDEFRFIDSMDSFSTVIVIESKTVLAEDTSFSRMAYEISAALPNLFRLIPRKDLSPEMESGFTILCDGERQGIHFVSNFDDSEGVFTISDAPESVLVFLTPEGWRGSEELRLVFGELSEGIGVLNEERFREQFGSQDSSKVVVKEREDVYYFARNEEDGPMEVVLEVFFSRDDHLRPLKVSIQKDFQGSFRHTAEYRFVEWNATESIDVNFDVEFPPGAREVSSISEYFSEVVGRGGQSK